VPLPRNLRRSPSRVLPPQRLRCARGCRTLPYSPSAFREVSAQIDVVVDYLNGPPAEAALNFMAPGGRMVQVGSGLASGIHIDAQLARRASLDVLGFAYYHAPIDAQADAYMRLCSLAAAGAIPLDYECVPLGEFEDAWQRQKSGSTTRVVMRP
jgi:D-arabinose 1-dehydrogenase-like Zn-dependent alcohol dehydrogenase